MNRIDTVLGQAVRLSVGPCRKGIAIPGQHGEAATLSADPDFAAASTDGIDDITIQAGD